MRTQASIWIDKKKTSPIDIQDFFKTIFFKGESETKIGVAELIIKKIINEGFDESEREKILDSSNITQKQYYSVLARMKAIGLIKKKDGSYIIDKSFINSLSKLSNFWESIYYRAKPKQERTIQDPNLVSDDPEDYID